MTSHLAPVFASNLTAPPDAFAWLDARLDENKIRATGAPEKLQERPWGLMLRVPTDAGIFYFKVNATHYHFEAPLVQWLAQLQSQNMPELLACDTARGWLLMRDSGARLREQIRATRDASAWLTILPQYARLQQTVSAHLPRVLDFGTPDYGVAQLPARYAEMLDATEHLCLDQPNGLTTAEHEQLRALAPQFQTWCEQLRAAPIPASIDHGDLHDANIFADGGAYRIADWGDACAAHPS